jgi:hypothetical protein
LINYVNFHINASESFARQRLRASEHRQTPLPRYQSVFEDSRPASGSMSLPSSRSRSASARSASHESSSEFRQRNVRLRAGALAVTLSSGRAGRTGDPAAPASAGGVSDARLNPRARGSFWLGPHPSPRVAVFAEGASPRASRIVLIAMARLGAVSPACWTTLMVYCPQAPQHAIEPSSPPGRPTRVLGWPDSLRPLSGIFRPTPLPA